MSRIGLTGALLIAFLVASGAPVLVFWLWPHNAALQREIAEVRERHLLMARTAAASIDQRAETVAGTFAALAPLIASGEAADFGAPLLAALDFRHVCVAERDGGRVVRAFMAEHAACPERIPPERLAMLTALADRGGVALSPVGTALGEPLLYVARAEGPLLVVGAIRTGFFIDLAASITFSRHGHAAIVDAQGRVLAHPKPDWVAGAMDLRAVDPVARLLAGESGVSTFVSPATTQQMIAGFNRAPISGIGVIVVQPLAELNASAGILSRTALAIFGAGLALATAIALAFSAHLARGVRRVADAARSMGRGETGVRVPEPVAGRALSEVATLGRAFNAMAQRVESAHARILAVACTDSLTGLANRSGFLGAAGRLLEQARREDGGVALFFLDVDRFKAINDAHGHAVGDLVLREVADRFRRIIGPDDLIGRQGGDEFLILRRKASARDCAVMGARLLRALRDPIDADGRIISVTASAGVATFPRDGADIDALVLHADQAMYEAKRNGRSFLRFFDAAVRLRVEEAVALKRELAAAISAGEVTAEYQPIVRAGDGALLGFEALARWVSPKLGSVAPDRFIAVAEDSGLIVELGRRVRRDAFAFAAGLRRAGLDLKVAVNVSPIELAHGDFARQLAALLQAHDLPPSAITLEITERLFRETGARELEALCALRRRGMGFALDDFGNGFSSHNQLRAYPVDRLKISANFIADVETDSRTRAMVRSMIDLGRSLGLTVTVEGVESETQRALVEALGADEIQGFWRHRPMDADAAMQVALASAAAGQPHAAA